MPRPSPVSGPNQTPRTSLRITVFCATWGARPFRSTPQEASPLPRQTSTEAGVITGQYRDANGLNHGFVRSPQGVITSFDVPGSLNTFLSAINAAGVVVGFTLFTLMAVQQHGFVRNAHGVITPFDPSGSIGTVPRSINAAGVVVGFYSDGSVQHGFVRSPRGAFTCPMSWEPLTTPLAINVEGTAVGVYQDANGGPIRGFVRSPEWSVHVVRCPGTRRDDPHHHARQRSGVILGSNQDANQGGVPRLYTIGAWCADVVRRPQ